VLTVVKGVHQGIRVLQNIKPDEQLRNTIVSKCSNSVNVIESTITSTSATRPDVGHKDLCSLI